MPRLPIAFALAVGLLVVAAPTGSSTVAPEPTRPYLVLLRVGADVARVGAELERSGVVLRGANTAVGMLEVTASTAASSRLGARPDVLGIMPDRMVGRVRSGVPAAARGATTAAPPPWPLGGSVSVRSAAPGSDPLVAWQWDLGMIRAQAAHRRATGRGVLVGVMDTGIDAGHPDLAGRVNLSLSRNFTVDRPAIDGPCAAEPDRSCTDPVTVDENEHGTHVAGTIAAGRNGRGIVGVAPEATLVNLRTGQDSGFFFLAPTVNALTYAADHGIDVVNMSYFIDPWLFNCPANRADPPAARTEQRVIIEATTRALRYAAARGVTLVAAAGNESVNLDAPTRDQSSPNYPAGAARNRVIDTSCRTLPTQGPGVIGVSAVGPSGSRAGYSNVGMRSIGVSAPGGDLADGAGTPRFGAATTLVLAPRPTPLALSSGLVDPRTGRSGSPSIVAECPRGRASCAYYQYLEGTSMAAPHASGVAALIVSRFGRRDSHHPGLTLGSTVTSRLLLDTAAPIPCPRLTAAQRRLIPSAVRCAGTAAHNSWYGDGLVDAFAAVSAKAPAGS